MVHITPVFTNHWIRAIMSIYMTVCVNIDTAYYYVTALLWCRKVSIYFSIKTKQPKKAKPASLHRNDALSSIILIALRWALSSMSMSLSRDTGHRTPGVASPVLFSCSEGKESLPQPADTTPLMQPETSLAFSAARACHRLMFNLVSTRICRSFCQLLSSWVASLCMLVSGLVLFPLLQCLSFICNFWKSQRFLMM